MWNITKLHLHYHPDPAFHLPIWVGVSGVKHHKKSHDHTQTLNLELHKCTGMAISGDKYTMAGTLLPPPNKPSGPLLAYLANFGSCSRAPTHKRRFGGLNMPPVV